MDATSQDLSMADARIQELEQQLAEANRAVEVTRAWCLGRMQRLRTFVDTLTVAQRQQYFDILADTEPPPL